MKQSFSLILCLSVLIFTSSCRNDLDFGPSSGNLEFSKDTVYLDTVFTNIGSSTYNLRVYNRSSNDINIPTIRLALGQNSEYRLNVDGMSGKEFKNIEILAKDSMYVFIETTIDINNLPNTTGEFLYTDKIEFDSGANFQSVELVTLVKDAVFIYPDKDQTTGVIETLIINMGGEIIQTDIKGRYLLPSELTFTNQKPYVVYGYAAVPNNETLTVEAGARVYFHSDSGILVSEGASLHVDGALSSDQAVLDNEVIFQGDRLEPGFSNIPGQWGTIWLLDGSVDNTINYATIKNAGIGILCEGNPDHANNKLTITNSQIYNSSNFGILGRRTSILAENLIINNSGQASFAATFGGKYNVTHSTIANYWNNSYRQFPALLINNFMEDESNVVYITDLTEANFNNCIIYGNDNIEFILDEIKDSGTAFNFKFTNNLIRFQDTNNNFTGPNYNFNNPALYEGNSFNKIVDFKNTGNNQMFIGDDSAANGLGNPVFATQVPNDILGESRTASPDSGAYQHTSF